MLSWLFRIFDSMRADDEDAARALRIQREYAVPEWAVEVSEPIGRRVESRPEGPASNYTREVSR